jgi:hypothetical protein
MATLVPAGVEIPYKGIEGGSIMNDDGHGWAVAAGSTLLVGKSMKFSEAIEGFIEARLSLGSGSVGLFHSRWATHGEYGEYNVHPFYVGEDEQTVMAHNGILPEQFLPDKGDRRSDTRKFVDRLGPLVDNPNGIPSRRRGAQLASLIGGGNKLVFLSVKSGAPKVRLVNADAGCWTKGVWYSNTGYQTDPSWKAWRMASTTSATPSKARLVKDLACDACGSWDIDDELGTCWHCGTCLQCFDNFAYCACPYPANMRVLDKERGESSLANVEVEEPWWRTEDEDFSHKVLTIGARPGGSES